MTPMRRIFTLLIAMSFSAQVHAEDPDIARLFSEAGIEGTMVIARLDGGETYVHNEARAERRFPSASTFKIFNTLIALDEGALSGLDEVIRWDGRVHDLPDWNQDHTLKSAYAASCVWCYQELARRIGTDRYRAHLAGASYGQIQEPFGETNFWLDGSLTISAREQVSFLRQMILQAMPYKAASYAGLREVMLSEEGEDYSLRAKTGWAARSTPQIGWYVGYIEKPGVTWIFAMNIDMGGKADLPLRQALTRSSLKAKGIIELSGGAKDGRPSPRMPAAARMSVQRHRAGAGAPP
jgi:beta-lactamase class D